MKLLCNFLRVGGAYALVQLTVGVELGVAYAVLFLCTDINPVALAAFLGFLGLPLVVLQYPIAYLTLGPKEKNDE